VSLLYLLDTSIISAPVAKQPNRRVAKQLAQHSMECALAVPVPAPAVGGATAAIERDLGALAYAAATS
jgi:predicted nucleic acid-binding protein